ncbi:hypothetical protein IAR55_006206 [Kwoniella newhampshirensis]|uniref:Trafficking protein particle complex subunit 10 n=1 Tax=Kwoniella newhampshirensis TaxID=1651941 RepID=A0AAW0YXV3_9TREE
MPRPVTVTYTLHPTSSQPSPILHSAIAGIRAHLPLRNLHWKSSSRTSLRTIQELDVELVELGEASTLRDISGSVLEAPLVNLCLVVCEDAEVYKNQTKNFIRDWLSLLAARRTPHAPLIVLVNPPNIAEKAGGKSVWGKDKGVLGKLKADFNVGKRDRCVQLNLPPAGANDPAAWPEVINKLKESLVTAFDGAILEREEEVKRGEAQRLTVGWNFCTWFLLKESLAQSFEAVNLPEDSLIIYEELEASFFQVLKEQNLSWFGKLGATGSLDDSLPILDPTVKPYRDMLRNSAISIFDFRIYVFARQGVLLGKLGRITEVAKRGQWFVASLTRRLRENEADLAEHFIESWTYTACMDIVAKCDQWSRIDRPNGDYTGLIAYESARSELLDIARVQVERLGVSSGLLPNRYPFQPPSAPISSSADDVLFESSSNGMSDDENPEPPSSRPDLSNKQLLGAISDTETFRRLYLDLTNKAIQAYEACGKVNSVVRLKTDLAALALYSEDFQVAYDLCRALAKDCAELLTWDPVSKFALEGALRSHRELKKEKEEDWENLALAYLRVCALVYESGNELQAVVDGLKEIDTEQEVEGHKAFAIRCRGDLANFEDDRTVVEVEVTNALQISVEVDSVGLDLANSEGEVIAFSTEEVKLQPGMNAVRLYCTTSTHGIYALQSANIGLGSILFGYSKVDDGARLRIKRNPEEVDVRLRMPYDIKLDDETRVVVEIKAGKTLMRNARIALRSLSGEVGYILDEAVCVDRDLTIDNETGFVALGVIAEGSTLHVTIPYTGVPQAEYAKAQIIVHYDGLTGYREWIDTQSVFMGLPLTVNVQDFFRPQCLLSHFTIASDGREYLRVASVNLQSSDGASYLVETCGSQTNESMMVNPNQPLSCIFKIQRMENDKSSTAVLRLVIRYRSLEEEIRQTVETALLSIPRLSRIAIGKSTKEAVSDRVNWLQPYLLSQSLDDILRPFLGDNDKVVKTFLGALAQETDEAKEVWRTLEIPVDVPQKRLLTTVRISPVGPSGPIYEGRAIGMTLTLLTSFAWVGEESQTRGKRKGLIFDVQTNPEDWLVLGKKKGYYFAEPNSQKEETQQIVLVPMRPGTLFLPSVHVAILPPTTDAWNQVPTHANGSEEMLCETYVENAGESLRVLPAEREVTSIVPVSVGVMEG